MPMNTPGSSQCIMDTEHRRPLLFLDKVFLKPRKTTLRGVELFNLSLIQDLSRNNFALTIPIHYSWKDDFQHEPPSCPPDFYEARKRVTLFNGLTAAWRLRRRPYHKIILANVANGLIPALLLLRFFKSHMPLIVFAHRMPSARFMAALPKNTSRVICVNSIIATEFKKAGFKDVSVLFGHMSADKFHPAEEKKYNNQIGSLPAGAEKTLKKINFCVIGFLDNAWKGADTALAAFRALPQDISEKCVLHLASFRHPPVVPEQNIRTYKWFPTGQMPGWLQNMDVMIVPSRDERVMRETFSLVMIEGMLTGLPILASNLPILVEKLDAGGGYIFQSVEELARRMATLATNQELRLKLGQEARRIALERYVWKTKVFVERYLA